jgi:hypothetical protein
MAGALNGVGASSREQSTSQRAITGNDYTAAFQELVHLNGNYKQRRQKWIRERDNSLGPIVSDDFLATTKSKEKSGQGISQKEKDCLRLRKADEEWIGEARKVVSGTMTGGEGAETGQCC